jgi:uncharacterized membrane protein
MGKMFALHLHTALSILLMLPCIIDSCDQYWFGVESTNFRRVFTGVLCGIGIAGTFF